MGKELWLNMNKQPTRLRVTIGALASVVIAFVIAVWAHEYVHVLQDWHRDGEYAYDMKWNPTFDSEVCEGHLACAGDNILVEDFWLGEGIAYVVTYVGFPLVFAAIMPRLAGLKFERKAKADKPAVNDAAIRAALTGSKRARRLAEQLGQVAKEPLAPTES